MLALMVDMVIDSGSEVLYCSDRSVCVRIRPALLRERSWLLTRIARDVHRIVGIKDWSKPIGIHPIDGQYIYTGYNYISTMEYLIIEPYCSSIQPIGSLPLNIQ